MVVSLCLVQSKCIEMKEILSIDHIKVFEVFVHFHTQINCPIFIKKFQVVSLNDTGLEYLIGLSAVIYF